MPADPQLIYVPAYQPAQVYYDAPYGAPFMTFGLGWPMGPWLGYDLDWGNGNILFWGRDHPRPSNWWHDAGHQRDMGHPTVWRPGNHFGVFPENRGDRGWSAGVMPRTRTPEVSRPGAAGSVPHGTEHSMGVSRPAPASMARSATISRPAATGAFIGIHSSSAARSYSDRGRSSLQGVAHSSRGGATRSGGGGSHGVGKR